MGDSFNTRKNNSHVDVEYWDFISQVDARVCYEVHTGIYAIQEYFHRMYLCMNKNVLLNILMLLTNVCDS